ncbi:MFS transporter [Lonsdalea quercina]|uniref:MFS transporter n=1 Tax=Lonsdalea quercina TaxID=71657 RepID=UPI0039757D86
MFPDPHARAGGSLRARLMPLALTFGAFAIGLDTFVAIGALHDIAGDLAISPATAGRLVSVSALCYAAFAPLSAWWLRAWPPQWVLLLSLACFIAGNGLSALSPTFSVLMVGRMVSALGAATFTPTATALAAQRMPPGRKGVALALIFGGMTMSQALGVPLTAWMSHAMNWHWAFYSVVFFGALAWALLFMLLAPTDARPADAPRFAPGLCRFPAAVWGLFCVTLLVVTSEFTVYAYISVLLANTRLGDMPVLPWVLMAYGIGSVLGNIATGILTDRWGPGGVLNCVIALQTAGLVALVLLRDSAVAALALGAGWGIVSYMYLVPIQHRLLGLAGAASQQVLAINSAVIYIGIGAGSALGGLLIARGGFSMLALIAGIIGILALIPATRVMRKPP